MWTYWRVQHEDDGGTGACSVWGEAELELFSLERRWLVVWGGSYWCVGVSEGRSNDEEARVVSVVPNDRTRGNRHR